MPQAADYITGASATWGPDPRGAVRIQAKLPLGETADEKVKVTVRFPRAVLRRKEVVDDPTWPESIAKALIAGKPVRGRKGCVTLTVTSPVITHLGLSQRDLVAFRSRFGLDQTEVNVSLTDLSARVCLYLLPPRILKMAGSFGRGRSAVDRILVSHISGALIAALNLVLGAEKDSALGERILDTLQDDPEVRTYFDAWGEHPGAPRQIRQWAAAVGLVYRAFLGIDSRLLPNLILRDPAEVFQDRRVVTARRTMTFWHRKLSKLGLRASVQRGWEELFLAEEPGAGTRQFALHLIR